MTRISSPRRRREMKAMTPSRLRATMRTTSKCEISVWKASPEEVFAPRGEEVDARDALRARGRDSDLISPTS